MCIPHDPRILLLEIHTHMHQDKYPELYIAALFIISTNSEQSKCLSTTGYINKLCETTMDYYVLETFNKFQLYKTT